MARVHYAVCVLGYHRDRLKKKNEIFSFLQSHAVQLIILESFFFFGDIRLSTPLRNKKKMNKYLL